MKRRAAKTAVVVAAGLPLLAGVVVMATRVGDTARFVTWPVTAFTMLATAVSLLGVWAGLDRPWSLAAGVLPALVLCYVLPAAPLVVIAAVLACIGGFAITVRGAVAGLAATSGALMVLFVLLQGPAVRCGASSVTSGSGPWWIPSPSRSSGWGSSTPGGDFHGTTQVGAHNYGFSCADGKLIQFERLD